MKSVPLKPTVKTRPAEARQRQWLARRVESTMALLRPGEMTTAQMLISAFGTSRPKGINVDNFPSHKETIGVSHMRDAKGYYIPFTNRICLRQDFLDAANDNEEATTLHLLGASIADHETMHFLQFLGVQAQDPLETHTLWHEARAPLLERFNEQACADTHRQKEAALSEVKKTCKFENPEIYLSRPIEIQARLHQLVVFGYSHWQKLPSSRMELYAALAGLGLSAPDDIQDRLKNSVEGRQASKDFGKPPFFPAAIRQFADHIEFVYQFAADKEKQRRFWEKTLPALYGNLLQLYGDPRGQSYVGIEDCPSNEFKLEYLRL